MGGHQEGGDPGHTTACRSGFGRTSVRYHCKDSETTPPAVTGASQQLVCYQFSSFRRVLLFSRMFLSFDSVLSLTVLVFNYYLDEQL